MGWTSWNGPEIERIMESAVLAAKNDTAEVILSAAKNQVPLDESTLLRSGTIIHIEDGGETVVVISFGGGSGTGFPKIPYAIRWHENSANFQHGRKRFYLKDPLHQLGKTTYYMALIRRLGAALR